MGAEPRHQRDRRDAPKQKLLWPPLKPSQEKQDDEDDQNDADDADAAVTVAVAVAAEPAAESAEQEDDEDDDEDESERHDAVLSFQRREKFKGCESREGRRGDGRDGIEKPRLLKPGLSRIESEAMGAPAPPIVRRPFGLHISPADLPGCVPVAVLHRNRSPKGRGCPA
jgi:hypothetical protein